MATAPYPTRPVLQPMVGTLLASLGGAVQEVPNLGWLNTGEGLYESYGQMVFGQTATFPCGPTAAKTLTETTDWVSGFRFGAYGGTTCRIVGNDVNEAKTQARNAFDLGESTAVEAAFMATRFKVAATENVVNGVKKWTDPVDITPAAGAVKPKVGIAYLEAWMARRYVGLPAIHLPTIIASLVMGLDGVALEETRLRTKLGSMVINGVGYDEPNTSPAGVGNAAGERWIYATGPLTVQRGPVQQIEALDRGNNDYVRLIERAYIASADGPTAGIRVQVTA